MSTGNFGSVNYRVLGTLTLGSGTTSHRITSNDTSVIVDAGIQVNNGIKIGSGTSPTLTNNGGQLNTSGNLRVYGQTLTIGDSVFTNLTAGSGTLTCSSTFVSLNGVRIGQSPATTLISTNNGLESNRQLFVATSPFSGRSTGFIFSGNSHDGITAAISIRSSKTVDPNKNAFLNIETEGIGIVSNGTYTESGKYLRIIIENQPHYIPLYN